ncbi:hypothetical protein [Nocardia sp. CNY236]|uniref:hypothetical protein n=1 Tax=Nocardia sp. CNY236 TaxID=1169152 RepID=UPI0004912388|nr:hypothetical protein [Nocardia sp. CNY236]
MLIAPVSPIAASITGNTLESASHGCIGAELVPSVEFQLVSHVEWAGPDQREGQDADSGTDPNR